MKPFFIILFMFIVSSAIDPEITALKIRMTKAETQITKDGIQIAALKKSDSIKNVQIKEVTVRTTKLETQITALKKVDSTDNVQDMAEASKLNSQSILRAKDSIIHWTATKKLQAVPSLVPELKFNRLMDIKDSMAKSTAIKILQSTSPTVQIPIIQNDIKNIQSKNVSQDKILVANSSAIKNVEDTMKSLIRDVGSDFTLDEKKKLIISKSGIDRIKAALPLP